MAKRKANHVIPGLMQQEHKEKVQALMKNFQMNP